MALQRIAPFISCRYVRAFHGRLEGGVVAIYTLRATPFGSSTPPPRGDGMLSAGRIHGHSCVSTDTVMTKLSCYVSSNSRQWPVVFAVSTSLYHRGDNSNLMSEACKNCSSFVIPEKAWRKS